MIELRWLVKYRGSVDALGLSAQEYKILQFRRGLESPYVGEKFIWSPWQEVPEIHETDTR